MATLKTHKLTGRQVFCLETPTVTIRGFYDARLSPGLYPYQLEKKWKDGEVEYKTACNPCIWEDLRVFEHGDELKVYRKATFTYAVVKRTKDEQKAGHARYEVVATDAGTGETAIWSRHEGFADARAAAKDANELFKTRYV